MSLSRADELAAIARLTDQVQDAINTGDWRGASEIESRRRAKLEALVAEAVRGGGKEELARFLESMTADVNRLIGEVHHHQRRVAREATMIRTGREATREYAATAEGR